MLYFHFKKKREKEALIKEKKDTAGANGDFGVGFISADKKNEDFDEFLDENPLYQEKQYLLSSGTQEAIVDESVAKTDRSWGRTIFYSYRQIKCYLCGKPTRKYQRVWFKLFSKVWVSEIKELCDDCDMEQIFQVE